MKKLHICMVFLAITAIFFVFGLVDNQIVLASPQITSSTINGKSQSVTFNPNNGEEVTIEIRASVPVKFTRLYICTMTQDCSGSAGKYTRYFTSSEISESISKVWNGRISSDSKSAFATAGEYRIMASMVEGSNSAVTEFIQQTITVNFSTDPGDEDEDDDSDENDGEETSTHSEQDDLSTYDEPADSFVVSAGRDRVTYVGSHLDFRAQFKKNGECARGRNFFSWSFGDGTSTRGETASHIYKYAGEYNVVLNAECGDISSVARTTISVLAPNLAMTVLPDGSVEVLNKSKSEMNLAGWGLSAGDKNHVFPSNTIVGAGKKVVFPREYTKLVIGEQGTAIFDPTGLAVASVGKQISSEINLAEVLVFAENYKKLAQVAAPIYHSAEPVRPLVTLTVANHSPLDENDLKKGENLDKQIPLVAAVATLPSFGFWSKLFHPVRTIQDSFYR